jgi:hypothetical protein
MSLMARRLALRPGSETPIASSKHVLRALARRWRDLNAEIQEHAEILEVLVRQVAPQVTAAFASVPIRLLRYSSWWATIRSGSAARRLGPSSAAWRLCLLHQARRPSTASTAGGHRQGRRPCALRPSHTVQRLVSRATSPRTDSHQNCRSRPPRLRWPGRGECCRPS